MYYLWRPGYTIPFAAGNTRADNANASQLKVKNMSAVFVYILWSMVNMCTTNAHIVKYPARVPFQYLPLALKWMDGYANGREKTLSWSEGVANLTVYHTK